MPASATLASWVLHDGAAGNRRQALALADALDLPGRETPMDGNRLARLLAPHVFPGAAGMLGADFEQRLRADGEQLAIGCGRLAALATRLARSAGHRAVQILDPRLDPAHWDLVLAPEHDQLRGDNVIELVGSLHPVDADWLEGMRAHFSPIGDFPGPRIAVLLGGPTRATQFNRGALEVLLAKLEYQLARDGGSLLVCGSRRTPPAWAPMLRARYATEGHRVWFDASDGENPYAGALAWADRIIVSPDSVNMVSEACATEAPVFVAEPGRATGRVRRFLQGLESRGRIAAQTRDNTDFPVTPLRETARVAALVRERLGLA
ncbi:ELM1/GtrOC1 family putative glycosyltransferase [soil metagenome]